MLKIGKYQKKREKQLQHMTNIAEAFLKARGVYPSDLEGFRKIAGDKEVDIFYQTMYLLEKGAIKWNYDFVWGYVKETDQWIFHFYDLDERT